MCVLFDRRILGILRPRTDLLCSTSHSPCATDHTSYRLAHPSLPSYTSRTSSRLLTTPLGPSRVSASRNKQLRHRDTAVTMSSARQQEGGKLSRVESYQVGAP